MLQRESAGKTLVRMGGVTKAWWLKALGATAVLGLGAAVSVLLGQDANWDLLNYHIRDPYTVLNGRMQVDLDPASLQSYFNPTLDLPFYLLATGPLAHSPRVLAAAMGLPFGALILATLGLSHRMFASLGGIAGPVVTVLAAASAVTGAATLTQVGTTFNEVPVSALIVFGLLAALPRPGRPVAGLGGGRAVLAGLLFGAAAGLKLTALIQAPALCLALLCVMPAGRWLRFAVTFSAGWAVAVLVLAGWWSWQLYAQFGNPLFPMFNAVFRSPWYPPTDFFDTHFLPHGALQWLFYPFWWAAHLSRVSCELEVRDPRLAVFLVAAAVMLAAALARLVSGRGRLPDPVATQAHSVALYTAIAYAFWLYSFSIMRYGIVLEITGTLTVANLLVRLAARAGPPLRPLLQAGLVAGLAVAYGVWTRAADYGHIPYGTDVFAVDMAWTPQDTLFVAITGPTAYVTAFVPPGRGARTIGFSYLNRAAADWLLTRQSRAIVAAHLGPIQVLIPPDDASMLPDLPLIGLDTRLGPCRQVPSNLDGSRIRACEATKLPSPAPS